MTDQNKIWKKVEKMSGGNKDPFDTPIGPTGACLSTKDLVSFVEGGENDPDTVQHLANCQPCRDWLARYKFVSKS